MKLAAQNFWKITTFLLLGLVAVLTVYIWKINDNVFRVNSSGQTYHVGEIDYSDPDIVPPDLQRVIGRDGKTGYVIREDFEELITFSFGDVDHDTTGKELPVYKSDGKTQIDVFIIG